MAHDRPPTDLPCDGDGLCMICKSNPPEEETLTCNTCVTPWHVNCLSRPPQTLADTARWDCPDCSNLNLVHSAPAAAGSDHSSALIAAIRAIESDTTLSDREKANKRQQLLSGKAADAAAAVAASKDTGGDTDVLQLLSGTFNCSFCMQLPERPVTTPCGHNFCLKCFEKWIGQGKRSCVICRSSIPTRMAKNPRINSSLVAAIRMAKMTKSNAASVQPKTYHFVHNQNRPDKAYTTERAKKAGKANAASGKIFVTCPSDYFGPIPAECDPRGMGVLVGETWEDRMECRQWGVHWPHVSGIAGQSEYGAQSVALSGGYEDDEDHGEWFLYTGSGGRDLSGNKRTNKTHSFDQKFVKYNEALRVSCRKGYPVRVVRSHKEKRSSYAPEKGVRYDGIYRIEKCWRKSGTQGFKVCRYLFVRCDNDPAPWTSDDHGDRPRPLPVIKEAKNALELTERKGAPAWDYDEEKGCWLWKIPPPESRKQGENEDGTVVKAPKRGRCKTTMMSVSERLLKEFCCLICRKVMVSPLTTPCAHNFCKACLEAAFAGQSFMNQRTCGGRRTLRAKKNIMKCPSCTNDISEYLQNPQVNRELMSVIETLQSQAKESEESTDSDEEMTEVDEKSEDASVEETATEVEEAETDAGNADTCTKTDSNLVEKKGKVSKPSPKAKPTRAAKKKKADAAKKKKADGGDTLAKKPLEETATTEESAEANTELSDKKESGVVDVGGKVKRTNKRKKEGAEVSPAPAKIGARTRSKKAKVEADD